jgi:hypothetical protein
MGQTAADQELLKAQIYALNAAQIELNLSLAYQAREQALLAQQQAARARLQTNLETPRYGAASTPRGIKAARRAVKTGTGAAPTVLAARSLVLDAEGRILWPSTLPACEEVESLRRAVERAVRAADLQSRRAGRGHGRERLVLAARDRLAAFRGPALRHVEAINSTDALLFESFLERLDAVLQGMDAQARTPASEAVAAR